ncbi:MAG TPA: caspase family protein, partial [Myxococcaceae bacterium]|nr:caspase family protein [Myxococcaceae bacterium]
MIESLLIVGLGLSLAATPAPQTRRFALIAGANEGGAGRIALRYAASDARAVARVFETLGGVAEQDRLLLLQPNRVGFDRALATLRDRLVGLPPESRTEVVVYYSGHSDEGGLLLGEDRLPYADLRRALNALPADVKIAVLDSCASGALTRSKGGIPRPAFLVDTSS